MLDPKKPVWITAEGLADDLISFANHEVRRFIDILDEEPLGPGKAYHDWWESLEKRAHAAVEDIDWVGYLSGEQGYYGGS